MTARNAEGREVREFVAIGPNGSPISVKAYAPDPASLGQLGVAGLTNIESNSKADPTVITCLQAHGLATGDIVWITSSDSVPVIDGARVVTVIDSVTFSVPVNTATGQTFTITGISLANPTVVTVAAGHLLLAGTTTVTIAGSNSTPTIDGSRVATYIDATTFSIPVNVTGAGTAGTVNYGRAGTTATTFDQAIIGYTVANPTVVTAGQDHGLHTGDTVTIAGSDGTSINGDRVVTVTGARTFTVPVNVTVIGTTGNYVKKLYRSVVLDRGGATSGGALVITSTAWHNTARTALADIQGSADGINWFNIPYALVATPRTFVTTQLTITTGVATTYLLQELIYWRYLSVAFSSSRNLAFGITATYVAFP